MAFTAAVAAPVLARRAGVSHMHQGKQRPGRAASSVVVRAVAAPVAADVQAELSSPSAVRKALLARGWDLAWVDGVTTEVQKRRLQAPISQMEAVIDYLESLGIPPRSVENMASINKAILGQPVDALQAVVDYAQRQGVRGERLAALLEAHPGLLTYRVAADGRQLEKAAARASVDLVERGGRQVAGVSYWREGAAFQASPVAPYKPSAL